MSKRLQQLQQFLAGSPNDTFLLFAISKEYEKMGEIDKALAAYSHLQSVDENYVGLYYHLGGLQFKKGDLKAAWATYTKGMEIAKAQGDQHALSELAGAKMEIDEDDLEA